MAGQVKSEDEWFAQYEIQLIRDAKRKRELNADAKEKNKNLPANYMLCPVDGTKMDEMKFKDIEINTCPSCKGIWLDRGELEELIVAHEKDKKGFFRRLLGFE